MFRFKGDPDAGTPDPASQQRQPRFVAEGKHDWRFDLTAGMLKPGVETLEVVLESNGKGAWRIPRQLKAFAPSPRSPSPVSSSARNLEHAAPALMGVFVQKLPGRYLERLLFPTPRLPSAESSPIPRAFRWPGRFESLRCGGGDDGFFADRETMSKPRLLEGFDFAGGETCGCGSVRRRFW